MVDDQGRPLAVDLNPRWQGSTNLQTQAETAAGWMPLATLEVARLAGILDDGELLRHRHDHLRPVAGSQMLLRAPNGPPCRVTGTVIPGVASRTGQPAEGGGIALSECGADDLLRTGAVPEPGTTVHPAAYLLRVFSKNRAVKLPGDALEGWAVRAVRSLYRRLDLVEVTPPHGAEGVTGNSSGGNGDPPWWRRVDQEEG